MRTETERGYGCVATTVANTLDEHGRSERVEPAGIGDGWHTHTHRHKRTSWSGFAFELSVADDDDDDDGRDVARYAVTFRARAVIGSVPAHHNNPCVRVLSGWRPVSGNPGSRTSGTLLPLCALVC